MTRYVVFGNFPSLKLPHKTCFIGYHKSLEDHWSGKSKVFQSTINSLSKFKI